MFTISLLPAKPVVLHFTGVNRCRKEESDLFVLMQLEIKYFFLLKLYSAYFVMFFLERPKTSKTASILK